MEDSYYQENIKNITNFASARTLRKIRKYKNLSQGGLSEKVNISQPYLSNAEKGKHCLSLCKFCEIIYGVKIDLGECLSIFKEEYENLTKLYRHYSHNRNLYTEYKDFNDLVTKNIEEENIAYRVDD